MKISNQDKLLLESTVIETADYIVDEIAKSIPGFNLVWGLSKTYLEVGIRLRQKRALEFVECIRDNPNIFTKKLLQTEEFQDGFIFLLEKNIRERNTKKREVLKKLLLQYSVSKEKKKFDLERLSTTLEIVSVDTLSFLIFLSKYILPQIEKDIKTEMSKLNHLPEENERLVDRARRSKKVNTYVSKWLYDRYNINSPFVKEKYKITESLENPYLRAEIANKEYKAEIKKSEPYPELIALGIFRIRVEGGLLGAGASISYSITKFGISFIDYLNKGR